MKGREITRDGRQRWTVGSIGECIHPMLPARRSAGAFLSSHFVRQARHEVHRAGDTADISAVYDILQLRSIGLDTRLSGPTRNASSTWIPSCRSSIAVRAAERWFAKALSPRSQEIVTSLVRPARSPGATLRRGARLHLKTRRPETTRNQLRCSARQAREAALVVSAAKRDVHHALGCTVISHSDR